MNVHSSRSHTIFRIVIECRDVAEGLPHETASTADAGFARRPPAAPTPSTDSEDDDVSAAGTDIGTLAPISAPDIKDTSNDKGDGAPGSSGRSARLRQRRPRSLSVDDAPAARVVPPTAPRTTFIGDGTASAVRLSILHLVDLAGSERVGKSGEQAVLALFLNRDAMPGTCRCERRALEGGHIHQQVTDNTWHCDFEACQVNRDAHSLPRVKAYAAAVHVARCVACSRKAARCRRFPNHLRAVWSFVLRW
jgi:hypothetical protein